MAEIDIRTIQAPNPGPFTLDGTRTYVLNGEVVIDPGPKIKSHLSAIQEAAPRLRAILITHRHEDHTAAAVTLKERSGAILSAPPGVLSEHVDEVLKDASVTMFGSLRIDAIATPGHTPEHFCFLSGEGDLFSGDTILGEGTTIVQGQMRDYIGSLQRLRERKPRTIYPGHGPVRQDAVAWIDHYLRHRSERDQQILAAIAAGAKNPRAIRKVVYRDLDPSLHRAAVMQIQAHLDYLSERGMLV